MGGAHCAPPSGKCIFFNFLFRWPGILVFILVNKYPLEILVEFGVTCPFGATATAPQNLSAKKNKMAASGYMVHLTKNFMK